MVSNYIIAILFILFWGGIILLLLPNKIDDDFKWDKW